jgi:hypothetical protein
MYRSIEAGYANAGDLLTGAGSHAHGGRWNPPASFATIYAAHTVPTAVAESEAHAHYYGWNLADDDWRKLNDDAGEESLTQAIGRAAFDAGLEGIIVRACDGGQNLVWFRTNLDPKSKTAIRNEGKLK